MTTPWNEVIGVIDSLVERVQTLENVLQDQENRILEIEHDYYYLESRIDDLEYLESRINDLEQEVE